MSITLLINVLPGETRIARLVDDRLVGIEIERDDDASRIDDIYMGRVTRVVPSIAAAFVDIGMEEAGFLALAEARSTLNGGPAGDGGDRKDAIGDYVAEGDAIPVQVLRDPVDGKGAKLSARVTIPGRHLVMTVGDGAVRVSRRITDDEISENLKTTVAGWVRNANGFVVRTSAGDVSLDELEEDARRLEGVWENAVEGSAKVRPPKRLWAAPDRMLRTVADAGSSVRIVIDDIDALKRAQRFCSEVSPDISANIEFWQGPEGLFDAFDVEEQIDAALSPRVPLSSSGAIIIEETAAMTVIDVDTGGGATGGKADTSLNANLEAVSELARQIVLRNLGGLLVVDAVPMKRKGDEAKVLSALRSALTEDPERPHVVGFTRMGLIEMTRPRPRLSLARRMMSGGHEGSGPGRTKSPVSVAYDAVRRVLAESRANPGKAVDLVASTAVAGEFEAGTGGAHAALLHVEGQTGRAVRVRIDAMLAPDEFRVVPTDRAGEDGV